ncbi:MAG: UvrD-helicase domain-containing protein [Clostridia bacterium]|nr:UvrD-helicase domain-containing protein [Clostridia bacterium]
MAGVIAKFIERRQAVKKEQTEFCNELLTKISLSKEEYRKFFVDEKKCIESHLIESWKEKWIELYNKSTQIDMYDIRKSSLKKKTEEDAKAYVKFINNTNTDVYNHNNIATSFLIEQVKGFLNPVEQKKLDYQQLSCIVKEADTQLVIAGAGTGKTTTIVGKIKYLLKTEKCKSEEILVLSYTNASATEMCERINKETGCEIDAMTFHKLGMNIITVVNNCKPNISSVTIKSIVSESLNKWMSDPVYLKKLVNYLFFNKSKAKTEFDFKTQSEYEQYLKVNQPVTFKNEAVKSYAEMDIANFLYKNGIDYKYEEPYKVNTSTSQYGRYLPDFYLPDSETYIEFFALDRKGNVPLFFKGKGNTSAADCYKNALEWKKKLHSQYGTKMIELYYYDKQEGNLLKKLENYLKEENIAFSLKTDLELWDEIVKAEGNTLDGLTELLSTIISLIKNNNYTFEHVFKLNTEANVADRANNFEILSLCEPLFNDYCNYLKANQEIDFDDMINMASEYIIQNKFIHSYKYVLVDEYQDISKSRYKLLKNMRDQKYYKLFCVGDDWQSIYRFAGSDVSYILDFDKYWGFSEKSKIETTYRFSKKLIDISSHFVMKNPRQIKKELRTPCKESGFPIAFIEGYAQKNAVDFMAEKLKDIPKNSSIYFIGRYAHDIKMVEESQFRCQYSTTMKKTLISYPQRKDLKIEFITAHRSKGLQADYVIILNNLKNGMGFPSKIQDDSVLQLLLEGSDTYEYAEERRLFYVAMTRAKKKVWLLIQKDNESEFVQELLNSYGDEIKKEKFTCPQCGGVLIKKSGKYGDFYGCTNYKVKGCK